MTEAAFKATYSDWRIVKSRKVVQLVFELPIETADQAYQVLGGMPNMASEIWCGIARLEQPLSRPVSQAEKQPGSAESSNNPAPIRADKEKRSFGEMQPSQQAGILCGEQAFRRFLSEKFSRLWLVTHNDPAAVIREVCEVNSRADIKPDNAQWSALVLAYRLWRNHPEYAS